MSLFEEAEKAKNPFGERKSIPKNENKNNFINQTTVLLRVLNEVFAEQELSKKKAKECSDFRTRIADTSWPLHNLQGNVSEPTWANMVNASIAGMNKTIRNSQPNGEWRILNYETKIDHDAEKVERLYLVVKFVDVDNESDLMYQNGVPVSTTVNVQTNALPQELIDALTNRPSDDSKLAGMIEQLVSALVDKTTTTSTIEPEPIAQKADSEPEPVVFND
jgi:hypothetical protein